MAGIRRDIRRLLRRAAVLGAALTLLALSGCVYSGAARPSSRPTPPDSYYHAGGATDTAPAAGAGASLSRALATTASAESGAQDDGDVQDYPFPALVQGKVVYVVDGDTAHIKLESGKIEKVRFIGIDTPESTIEHEPYGKQAADFTRWRLSNRTVYLETDVSQRDKYDRLLAYVWMVRPTQGDGTVTHEQVAQLMFNAWLVGDGYAQMMTIPPNVKYADDFRALERFARDNDKGLWSPEVLKQAKSGGERSTGGDDDPAGAGKAVGKVIGNCNSLKFHRPDCPWAAKIATSHKLSFDSREDAIAAGYRPCKTCKP